MGTLFDGHLYISSFISGAAYLLKSLEIQFSMCQLTESACVIFSSPFISYGGVHSILATRKNGATDSFIFLYVRWKWKGPATSFGHSRSFTAAWMGGKLAFSSFPQLWEEEKRQLLLYRRSHRRYNCNFRLCSALRGGKLAVAALPPLS